MKATPSQRIRALPAVMLALGLCGVPLARAAESPATILRLAWEEYGFQNWSAAERLFGRVLSASDASRAQKLQARFGQAFIVQNRLPGRAPERAIPLYEALRKELTPGDPLEALAVTCLGACYMDKKPADYARARACFRDVLARYDPAKVFLAQDAALRLLASYLRRPDLDEFRQGLAVADEVLPRLEGTPLASVAHGFAAQLAFNIGDLPRFEAELVKQESAGIESRAVRGRVLFQIARLNETVLKDYAKAAAYYRRLHVEIPTSGAAHFAGLRAAELEAGKLNSEYAPPLVPEAPAATTPPSATP